MYKTLKKNSILILGYGREGKDNLSFLRSRFPKKEIGVADRERREVDFKNVRIHFGEDYLDAVEDYDIIIKSPGVPMADLKKFSKTKIITSQTDIFLKLNRGKVVGVTGTKGKSTTCLAIYTVLKEELNEDIYLLGNIGKPVLDFLDKEGIFIYELSSFQLQTTTESPEIALFLNLFRDHLDQHENFKEYINAKENITRFQSISDILIYNKDDESVKKIASRSKAKKIEFDSDERLKKSAVYMDPILKTVELFGVSEKRARKIISKLDFLPHRLEYVGEYEGIDFYDDSAATLPEATIEAIKNLSVNTLIVGGVDKGGDYRSLASEIVKNGIKNVILFPETGKKIEKHLKNSDLKKIKIFNYSTMEEAVRKSFEITSKKGVCLLSPASSSFNMFSSYKDRGEQFKKYIKKYGER